MSVVQIDSTIFNHDAQSSGFSPDTHVDLCINFKKLISQKGGNYILEGIRGTGKTHILKMIITEASNSLNETRIIPAYVTVASAPQLTKKDPKYFRVFLYISIIKYVMKFINDNKEKFINEAEAGMVKKLVNLFGISEEATLEKNIKKILLLANNIISDLYDNPDKIITRVRKKSNFESGAGINVPPLSATVKMEDISEDEKIKEYTTQKLSDIYGIDILISFLKTVKKLLSLNYIYILLDECSESTKEMQIEIFRLCKQIRGSASGGKDLSKPDIVFIAAVYPPHSTYYPATTRGDDFNFQPGHDCTLEYLELDELNDEYEPFFKQLIENRLAKNTKAQKSISEVFENENLITIAAYCSGGVPRRFFEILKQAYTQLIRDFEKKKTEIPKKIDINYIISAVAQVVEGPSLLIDSTLTDQDNIILEKIIKRFARRNKGIETKNSGLDTNKKTPITIYFTTAARSAGEIANLISVGIIHDKKRTRSRKTNLAGWKGSGILCSLDFGVALHRGIIPKVPSRLLEVCTSDIHKAAYRGFTYVLDIALEEESLDLEYEETKDNIQALEERMRYIEDLFLKKELPESHYTVISERTENMLETQRKKIEKINKKLEKRRKQTTMEL
ncbi:hypothetical protein KAI56_05095 [Candidatus Parcubacteria bacterium]|nr:hypothetical protein [Candidatus Parcubacteria bacterium]